jgi:hypothetical protein
VRPDLYFPYRFGEALMEYIAQRWGDEVIGEIMQATPSVGIDRAFRRYTGADAEELGEEWKEAMQTRHLPQLAQRERARRFAQPMLNRCGARAVAACTWRRRCRPTAATWCSSPRAASRAPRCSWTCTWATRSRASAPSG